MSQTNLHKYIETNIKKANKIITKFAGEIATEPESAAYHFEWGRDLINASQTLSLLSPIQKAIEKGWNPVDIAKLFIESAERHLLGPTGMGAGEGPWSPNSTSPMSNMMAVAKANAYREIRSDLIAIIEGY